MNAMELPSGGKFSGWEHPVNVGGPVESIFRPSNGIASGLNCQDADFKTGLQEIHTVIATAQANGKRLRAYGSRWTFSNVGYEKEYQIESRDLNYCKIGFDSGLIDENYHNRADRLVFVQAGVMVKYLVRALESEGLALSTTGFQDGQRLVGAVATGTHGSRVDFGSMQEMVKAIHLVLPNKRHVLLQRNSDKTVTERFCAEYLEGAELLDDNDDAFNAALVHLGSFGIVHGLLIETEPLCNLEKQVRRMSYCRASQAFQNLDVASLGFENFEPGEIPFDVLFCINQNHLGCSRSVTVVAYRKLPLKGNATTRQTTAKLPSSPPLNEAPLSPRRTPELPSSLCKKIREISIRRFFFGYGVGACLRSYVGKETKEPELLLPSQAFTGKGTDAERSSDPVKMMCMELAFSIDDLEDALDVILESLRSFPVATAVSLRYVPPSKATLAFSRFSPLTVTANITTAQDPRLFCLRTKVGLDNLVDVMDQSGIPYTFHWGKWHPEKDVLKRYDAPSVDAWKMQRSLLLGPDGCKMFANEWLRSVGLY